MVDLSYYVMQPLITNIKSGNIWNDCLIIIISVFCITCISKLCSSVIEKLQSLISSISWRRLKARYAIDIMTNSNDITETRMQVPEEYLGVIHYLHIANINKKTTEDPLDDLVNYFITSTGKQDILIAPNIYLHVEKKKKSDSKDYSYSYRNSNVPQYKIILYSYKLTLK
ncbi:hypothetical protein I4U23_004473 [Adineta vaga]|nr:hypothetical protein I4U23_004473 [Adineta vaga]